LIAIGLLVIVVGGLAWWGLAYDGPPKKTVPYSIDIAAVRALAEQMPGGKATDIRVEIVATTRTPTAVAVGNGGLGLAELGALSFQVILPDQTIVIDTGFTRTQSPIAILPFYDEAAGQRVADGLAKASKIVATHEHADHIGGLATYLRTVSEVPDGIVLTKEQTASLSDYLPPEDRDAFRSVVPIDYQRYRALAPGVVLIKAPGHTPGSQMIYVKRADGRELLFVGDIAWLMAGIEDGVGKSRLMVALDHERVEQLFPELDALKALHAAEPNLLFVPGHDVAAVRALVSSGAMVQGFKL
jgi:glyoxylase-like metal-dependent hydrolase (beta-lactamase superfamily II)